MKPNKEEFIEKIAPQLDDEQAIEKNNLLSEAIYTVLFAAPLSQLTESQLWFLSLLLHSEKKNESQDLLTAISTTFPETGDYIKNLYKHKDLLIKGGRNAEHQLSLFWKTAEEIYGKRIYFIKWIHKSLLDIFGLPNNYEVFQTEVWNWFIVQFNEVAQPVYEYLSTHFTVSSYDPISWALKLSTNNEHYKIFEANYLRPLKDYFKRIGYVLKKLEYIVEPTGSVWHTGSIPKHPANREHKNNIPNPVFNTIKCPEDPRYTRDNYHGDQKEKVKTLLAASKNIFIGGNDNLGKSHLIQAVINKYKEEWSNKSIVYTTGNRLYNEIQKRFADDRKDSNKETKNRISTLLAALHAVDILIIDDFDIFSWTKFSSQDIINKICIWGTTQIVILSDIPPAQIQRHTKTMVGSTPDYIPASLMEKISPVLVQMEPVDFLTKKKMARDIRDKKSEPNLFMTQEVISWVIDFMAEHISPKIYTILIESIVANTQWDELNLSQKIYEIIKNMTGKTIIPTHDKIVDIIVEEFNCDDIKKYIDKTALFWWIAGNIDRNKIYNDKRVRADSIEWVVLRACIYFIRKYYPDESLDAIGQRFNRTNAASLCKEGNEWLKSNKLLEKFLDDQIRLSLEKKYWLAHTI